MSPRTLRHTLTTLLSSTPKSADTAFNDELAGGAPRPKIRTLRARLAEILGRATYDERGAVLAGTEPRCGTAAGGAVAAGVATASAFRDERGAVLSGATYGTHTHTHTHTHA
jgi:hypothetical protein